MSAVEVGLALTNDEGEAQEFKLIHQPVKLLPEVKERWLAALRSGEYKQGQGRLRDRSDGYCCLGVACDLFDPEGWGVDQHGQHMHRGTTGYPTQRLSELTTSDGGFWFWYYPVVQEGVDKLYTLAELNDGGYSFTEIAKVIEEVF